MPAADRSGAGAPGRLGLRTAWGGEHWEVGECRGGPRRYRLLSLLHGGLEEQSLLGYYYTSCHGWWIHRVNPNRGSVMDSQATEKLTQSQNFNFAHIERSAR